MFFNVKPRKLPIKIIAKPNIILPELVRSSFWKGDIKIKSKPSITLMKKRGYRATFSQKVFISNYRYRLAF